MKIPTDPIGYSVEGGTIHTRYADHANGQRTRTEKGVRSLLGDSKGKVCTDCYPAPRYTETPRPPTAKAPQKRRNGTHAPPLS